MKKFTVSMKITRIHFAILLAVCLPARAALPLSIDELLSNKGEFKLETSLSYLNSSNQSTRGYDPVTIQTGASSYVTIPSFTSDVNSNSDIGIATLGIRYGVSKQLETSFKSSYMQRQTRSANAAESDTSSKKQFQDAWAGLNYQLSSDSSTQKTSVFAEVALYEKGVTSASRFKSYQIGASSYYSLDPVVLSINGALRNSLTRKDGMSINKPGSSFQLSPAIAFAVNEKVTLTTGLQWLSQQAGSVDGVKQGLRRTSYNLSHKTQLSINIKANVSERGGAETRLSLIHALGDKAQRVNTPAASATGVSQP
jgi:hypothetical protein